VIPCVALSCCAFSANNPAGELGKARLSQKPVEVLGGRLLVRLPLGARKEARPFDIMSAPESEEHEARVVIDADQEVWFKGTGIGCHPRRPAFGRVGATHRS
jgi:hypothetical protein